jgi:hypothetical protein
VHRLPHSAGVHNVHTPHCNLVPVLLTWHSTLYNPTPLSHQCHAQGLQYIDYFGRVGQGGNRLNTRHPLQFPLLNLSGRCCRFVLKHMAFLQAFENNSALEVLRGQFFEAV